MNNDRRKQINDIIDELANLRSKVEDLRNEEQEAFDNLPEGLKSSDRGQVSEQAASRLEDALSSFDEIDCALNEAAE